MTDKPQTHAEEFSAASGGGESRPQAWTAPSLRRFRASDASFGTGGAGEGGFGTS
ncbi:hypothetical protein [Sphingosinicella sp. LY1275]|uniref:hypothetical protein n=1 Tax=Sphingosinicella sp. LY1275 TaxID=3095379 RepID=UPI002ADEF883|nr:hypothetical protein [Sphingosinicella sp. LY1275]MEA1013789.1 hypothetical protein [Sphingosinicella sp. LY1275]